MVLLHLTLSFLAVSFLLLIIGAWGVQVLSWVFPYPLSRIERWLYGQALGLGCIAFVLFVLGVLGLYHPLYFILIVALPLVVYRQRLTNVPVGRREAWNTIAEVFNEIVRLPKVVWCGVGLTLLISAIAAGAPVHSGDDLYYYMFLPKAYLAEGKLVSWIPHWSLALGMVPSGGIQLFTLMYGLGGELFAQVFAFLTVLMATAAHLLLFRKIFGLRVAVLSCLILLTTPIVGLHLSSARVDFLLLFYSGLAMYALYRGLKSVEERSRWIILGGFCLGLAMTIKPTAIILFILTLVCLLALRLGRISKDYLLVKDLLFIGAAALAVPLPWFLRSWWLTGNPVWPFFNPILSGLGFNVLSTSWSGSEWGLHLRAASYYLLLPWRVTFDFSSSGGSNPAFLAYLPLLFVVEQKRPLVYGWFIFCVLFILVIEHFYYFFRHSMPVLSALSLLTAYVIEKVASEYPWMTKVNRVFLSALAIFAFFMAARSATLKLPVVLGIESVPHFIERNNFHVQANKFGYISQTDLIKTIGGTTRRPIFSNSVRFIAPCDSDFLMYYGEDFCRRLIESSVKAVESGQAKYFVQLRDSELLKGKQLNAKLLYDSRAFEISSVP